MVLWVRINKLDTVLFEKEGVSFFFASVESFERMIDSGIVKIIAS